MSACSSSTSRSGRSWSSSAGISHFRCCSRWSLALAAACAGLAVAVESEATIPGLDGSDMVPYLPTILGWQLAVFFLVVAAGALVPLRRRLSSKALVATGIASRERVRCCASAGK